jgi:hypothetical protein
MKHCIAFVVACVLSTSLASAQIPVNAERRITATVTTNGPIYLSAPPSPGIPPLRTAAPGTLLRVLGEKDDWLQVEFNDPQYGQRLGWIQKKFVTVDDPALRPMDLSVPRETVKPSTPSPSTVAKPATTAVAAPPTERANQAPVPPAATTSASTQGKSRSMGFFVGVNYEGNGAVVEDIDGADSGAGFGVTLGYGFTPQLALYGQLSGASMESGSYALGHFDIGLRAHFRAPAKTVVPFVQVGLSGRAFRQDVFGDTVEAGGAGFSFGAGLNAHFTPAVAFTTGVAWAVGNLGNFKVSGISVTDESLGLTTARVHFGIIWFPQAK